jgi:hypothetical protein
MAVRRDFIYNQQVEEIAKRARTARSNEELASVCRQLNIADSIFLGKVDLWLAKNALSALYRTLKKYPALRGSMHYFGTLNGFINNKITIFSKVNGITNPDIEAAMREATDNLALDCLDSFKNNCLAVAIYVGTSQYSLSGIIINGKSMNQQDILKNIELGELLGHSPKGCSTIKSVIEHEIGHVLDQMLGIGRCYEFQSILSQCSVSYLRRNLSRYCVMNNTIDPREVIAEAYSEYCNNPHPREVARAIGLLIDNKYKEKYGGY